MGTWTARCLIPWSADDLGACRGRKGSEDVNIPEWYLFRIGGKVDSLETSVILMRPGPCSYSASQLDTLVAMENEYYQSRQGINSFQIPEIKHSNFEMYIGGLDYGLLRHWGRFPVGL